MKWPEQLILIRHDVSTYNTLKERKMRSNLYRLFLKEFEKDPISLMTRTLATSIQDKFALGISDAETPLEDAEAKRAEEVGLALRKKFLGKPPHVIFVSPYRRAKHTLDGLKRGWPELNHLRVIEDERIREQEHGLALLYNDWRVFHTLHPEQRQLLKLEGAYWYRYPQGESVPDVRERNRSWMNSITRDFVGKRVLVMTHHLNILAIRANLERWSAAKFLATDQQEKPINCGVTIYRGYPDHGQDGHLHLCGYNQRLYK